VSGGFSTSHRRAAGNSNCNVRSSAPENTMRVRLLSGTREVQAWTCPSASCRHPSQSRSASSPVMSPDRTIAPFVRAQTHFRDRRADYEVVDGIDASASVLPKDQREAMWQRVALHSLDVSGDIRSRPAPGTPLCAARPPRRRASGRGTAYFSLCDLLRRCRSHAGPPAGTRTLVMTTAGAIVVVATAAMQAVGRIGPGRRNRRSSQHAVGTNPRYERIDHVDARHRRVSVQDSCGTSGCL
jgi:hypothetical protein